MADSKRDRQTDGQRPSHKVEANGCWTGSLLSLRSKWETSWWREMDLVSHWEGCCKWSPSKRRSCFSAFANGCEKASNSFMGLQYSPHYLLYPPHPVMSPICLPNSLPTAFLCLILLMLSQFPSLITLSKLSFPLWRSPFWPLTSTCLTP